MMAAPMAVASAVTPPPVDDTLLPPAGPPAPTQRTEQRRDCAGGGPELGAASGTTQLAMLDLPQVWPLSRGAGQTVAVIDTGVSRHRLLPRLLAGGDYVSTGDGTDDCDGHGTLVAGIIAATGAFNGVAPDATVLAIRQSSNTFGPADDPAATGYGDVHTLARAVRAAADRGATVINVSSVACLPAADILDDRALGAALSYAVDERNAVVVAAAGNVGGPGQCPEQNPTAAAESNWAAVHSVASPAWYDDLVLTVASSGADGAPSPFSLAGPWVDVSAPGEHVVSLDPDGEGLIDTLPATRDGKPIAGTSYSAPVVSGVVALVRARWPQLTARQVMQRIEDTAHHPPGGWDPLRGHGIVDVVAAVSGGAPAGPPESRLRALDPPVDAGADPRHRRLAMAGAGVCVVIAVLAAGASARGPRRRLDDVAHH
ncbi:type VII secretion-associated serine protease mycosin [Mycobacterium sp. PS03-16]|nr:type VII secretion-associated serine protease mycosin [Mycobacterium sp. PS03-16]TFV54868.1 type VII secretion-associated serine protease mycosin [Mycobacterium sp. PS03-16]